MSRNSAGTYSLPTGNPVVSGSIISSTWANDTMNDIASALTDSLSRSGKGGMSAAFKSIDGAVATPGISFNNEAGSGLYRAGAGDVRLAILGSDVFKLTAAGAAITGTLSSTGNATVGGTLGVTGATTFSADVTINSQNLALSSSTAYYPQIVTKNKTADANASYHVFDKDRAGAIIQSGDILGNVIFRGFDGTNYVQAASIIGKVNGTPGTNDMPGALSFLTTTDGASAPTERLEIAQTGQATFRNGLNETKTAPSISTNTLTLNCANGNVFSVSLNANITTLSFTNIPSSSTAFALTLALTANGTAYTITWPAAVKWPGGTAPTLTSTNGKVDTFILTTWDAGTTWYAFVAGQNL